MYGIISKERLENSINALVNPGEFHSLELRSVVLVNSAGDIAAAAGTNVDLPSSEEMRGEPNWDGPVVWLPNLVDLGTNLSEDMIVVVPGEVLTAPWRGTAPWLWTGTRRCRPRSCSALVDERGGIQISPPEARRP